MRQSELIATLRAELAANADPRLAPGMQAYMKSEMPYLGLSVVPLRRVCKTVFAALSYDESARWQDDVLAIWRSARFREERYAAILLTGIKSVDRFQRIDALPMYEEMIATGAWWDHVDSIAVPRLWALLRNDRQAMTGAMLAWAHGVDMWKRRSSIICQLHAKAATDLDLLYHCIEPSLGSKEFFLRKAIGWSLRQYARTDPAEVRRYVDMNSAKLSPLSRREALKRLG